ncbi:hypothetical protein V492_02429, partial [Pseudogymnoascus sp. VKM F-4246]
MSYYGSFSSQYQGTPAAVFYHTCPWTFTPAAKDQLDVNFTAAIEVLGLTAQLSYDHDKHFFKIECLPKEEEMVRSMFSNVIDTFTEEQVGPNVKKEGTLVTKVGPIPFGVRNELKEASDDVLLEGFLKMQWSCAKIELLGRVFDTKLLRQIGELTECTLTYDSESRVIKVVSLDQEACHRAIVKLDKVRDYEVPLHNNPYPNQAHIFYAEEHTEYAPVPTPIKTVHTLYENTLIDISAFPNAENSPYLALSKAVTLRCAIFDENRHCYRSLRPPKKPEPSTKEEQMGAEFKAFSKHQFAEKGRVDPVVGIVEGVEQIEDAETEGVIAPEKKAGIEVWVRGVEEGEASPDDTGGKEKGPVSPVKEADESSHATEIAGTSSNDDAKKKNRGVSRAQAATNMDTRSQELIELFAPPNRAPAPARGPERPSLMDMDIGDHLSRTLQTISLLPTALTAPITPAAPVSRVNPPSIPKPSTEGTTQPLIEPLVETLIEPLIEPIIETLQAIDEPSTRTYHHTMNLKAASNPKSTPSKGYWAGDKFVRASPPSLVSDSFLSSIHTATAPLLQALRGWHGSATLDVKIGRIWIAGAALGLSESDARSAAHVDKRKVARWLEGARRADMSVLVTEKAEDVEAIIGMKLFDQDTGFWSKRPKWGIEYMFSCVDPREVGEDGEEGKFMVTLDAETFQWRCETGDRCLGETWVHCLKRVWDFKVCATGRQEVGGEYAEWAAELVEGLYIPPNTDTTNLSLSFSLPEPHALSFPTIRVARKCTYTSITGTILLHITEMHDLRVERVGSGPDGSIVYRASARPDKENSHQETRWFEVSFSGKGWKEKLDEEVEVGGERKGWGEEMKAGLEEVVGTAAAVV